MAGRPSDNFWVDGSTNAFMPGLNVRENLGKDYSEALAVTAHWITRPGSLAVATGTVPLPVPLASILSGVVLMVSVAPTGADLIVDVNANLTTVFSGTKPTVAAGQTVSTVAVPTTTSLGALTRLTVDIDQVGSTIPGSDLGIGFLLRTVPV